MLMILQMLQLLAIDAALIALLALALSPLIVFRRAAFAVLKRNFVGYFNNPTGYVFLCLFVLLTTFNAFWPHEFFSANLANLDQLNKVLPWIMLLFISSITMSIWSEERRQGTDELLLTLPADDFDIVVGKYLAAASIFTASLLFSQLANFAVLVSLTLGDLDVRLLFTTYLGYWLMGLAMLAVGMVASFLTNNPTIAFIFGTLFNVPLVLLYNADRVIPWEPVAQRVRQWSLSANIDDFSRGVISFSGLIYFGMIIVVGIYFSMILVGRRHWMGGRDGHSMFWHYLVRGVAIIVVALSANVVFSSYDLFRSDLTEGQVSSLSPATESLIRNLNTKSPVRIDAYISANVPDDYMKTKHDLVSMLKALERLGGKNVQVRLHENIDPFSEEALLADQRYGIKPQRVNTQSRGSFKDEQIMLGAAFTCGLEKIVIPFFEYGVPIEYELVRSIATVARDERYVVGVVATEAQMMGGSGGNMFQPRAIPKRAIIAELEQQYKVENVDPTNPIDPEKYDVLFLVQPSSLAPAQLPNVLNAIKAGVPTAIFEDPLAVFMGVPGTGQPKQNAMQMFQQGPPPEKCDITELWKLIGVDILGERSQSSPLYIPDLVWQDYNPYPNIRFSYMGPEFVYIRNDDRPGASPSFNPDDIITSGLEEILFPFPGGMKRVSGTGLEFEKLCTTREGISGSYPFNKWVDLRADLNALQKARGPASAGEKIVAARIKGKRKDDVQKMADDKSDEKKTDEAKSEEKQPADQKGKKKDEKPADGKKSRKPGEISVVYVCDIDCMGDEFVGIRNRPDGQFNFRFDNVTFVQNVLDSLAGDERFIEIRKRKLRYSTLKLVEAETERIRKDEVARREQLQGEFDKAVQEAEASSQEQTKALLDKQKELQLKQQRSEPITIDELNQIETDLQAKQKAAQDKLKRDILVLQTKRDTDVEKTRREFEQGIQKIQSQYKFWAVVLPPLPPLLVGLVVFVRRRLREREGISRTRLK